MSEFLDLVIDILSGVLENWDKLNKITKKIVFAIIISIIIIYLYLGFR